MDFDDEEAALPPVRKGLNRKGTKSGVAFSRDSARASAAASFAHISVSDRNGRTILLPSLDPDLEAIDEEEQESAAAATDAIDMEETSKLALEDDSDKGFPAAIRKFRNNFWKGLSNTESIVFALRICISVTVASIPLLIDPTNDRWPPQETWIYTTAAIVSWQPKIDTATVLKKTTERTIGTSVGAITGMIFGIIALEVPDEIEMTYFGIIVALHGFFYPFFCDKLGLRSNYAAWMGNFTFGIVFFSFVNQSHAVDPLKKGCYRVVNILLGCVIVAVVSLVVWPIPTRNYLIKRVNKHMKDSGESSEMALDNAVQVFSGEKSVPKLVDLWGNNSTDGVHQGYIKNIESWKDCRALFPVLKYDPWYYLLSKSERVKFRNNMMMRLQRSFRIQLNVVMLDAIVRADIGYSGCPEALSLLKSVGRNVKTALDLSIDEDKREEAVQNLLEIDLANLRKLLARRAEELILQSQLDIRQLHRALASFIGLPLGQLNVDGEQEVLFFQLVEQLIVRVARIHYSCVEYKPELFLWLNKW